ncbi:MAG: sialate O-acetylesterase [Kiritimatiellia bacterium]|jgi:sialate O-acetylesterase
MVLQRGQENPIWGWGEPDEEVSLVFAGKTLTTRCDAKAAWSVKLPAMEASRENRRMTLQGKNTITLENILVGEVWVCSGQSNMGMSVNGCWNADLEMATAKYPLIRHITNPNMGSQEPQTTFKGTWETCAPENIGNFSAVGYFFGRTLHQMLDIPIGLIDNSWGGSACESWIPRDRMEGQAIYQPLLDQWKEKEANYDWAKTMAAYDAKVVTWEQKRDEAKAAGKPLPLKPRPPRDEMIGQHRPANLYNARHLPIVPYGIRGAIWYQGESNANRAYQYRDLFPLMIQTWRDDWQQGDFPFYWVQLADFRDEVPEPAESTWAELREAQTMTMARLKNTGQAVITDLGEASDIHPKNKQDVALRLARWALAKDYGVNIPYRSAEFDTLTIKGDKATITFAHVNGALRAVDHKTLSGFELAGEDKKWFPAEAKLKGSDQVDVSSEQVAAPVAVRYAWADNPVCNLYDQKGLPVTPFRTDDWPGLTAEVFTR